jgi:hypothetical protein
MPKNIKRVGKPSLFQKTSSTTSTKVKAGGSKQPKGGAKARKGY